MTCENGLKKQMAEAVIEDYPHIRFDREGYGDDRCNLAYWLCSTLQNLTDIHGAPQRSST